MKITKFFLKAFFVVTIVTFFQGTSFAKQEKLPSQITITVLNGDEFSQHKSDLTKYLSDALNIPVKIKVLDYDTFSLELQRGDSCFYKGSPMEYILSLTDTVLLKSVYKNSQTGNWEDFYVPVIIAGKNIKTLKDIESAKFFFTNPNSASGFLYPKIFLISNNISVPMAFPDYEDSVGAEDVYKFVKSGKWDAGCSYYGLLENDRYFKNDKDIKVFETGYKIIQDPFWADEDFQKMYPEVTLKVAELLQKFFANNERYRLEKAKDSDYDDLRIKFRTLATISGKDFIISDKLAGLITKNPKKLDFILRYEIHIILVYVLLFLFVASIAFVIFKRTILKKHIAENKIITEKYDKLVSSLKEQRDYNLQINKIETEVKDAFANFTEFIKDSVIVNYIATGEFLYKKYGDISGIEPSAVANCYVKAFERVVMISAFGAETFEEQDDVKVPDQQQNIQNKLNPKKILDNGIREIRVKAELSNKEYKSLQKCKSLRNKVAHLKPVTKEEVISIRKTLLGESGYIDGIIAKLAPYFKI